VDVVHTDRGPVTGRETPTGLAFRGLPYARARRFGPPEPAPVWRAVREAHRPGPACPQPDGPQGRPSEGVDEDCLVLDVWTPGLERADRPVLVFLHGGAFTTGSGAMAWYDGTRLSARGAVVVTVNYRLGALGWLHLDGVRGAEPGTGNRGLQDQLAALDWVVRNIERFGGDPERICLFGQSAGAMSVATIIATPPGARLVRRAVCQSGAQANVRTVAWAEAVTDAVLAAAGCTSPSIEDLRGLPVGVLLAAQGAAPVRADGTLPWGPVIDGAVLDRHPAEGTEAGVGAGIDLLCGVTAEEMRFYSGLGRRDLTEDRFEARVARLLGAEDGPPPSAVRTLADGYRTLLPGMPPADRWDLLQGDHVFGRPADRLVTAHGRHARAWSYLFAHRGSGTGGRFGSCHAMDLPFVFDTLDAAGTEVFLGPDPDQGTRALAATTADAWVGFAATGDPRVAPALEDWAPFADGARVAVLDRDVRVEVDPLRPRYDLWEGTLWP
jgi:para-nitrobenzyl esterase